MVDFTASSGNDELLQQAAELAEDGNTGAARALVKQAIHNNSYDAEAWWALTHLASSDAERNHALNRVLSLEPDNPHALLMRDQLYAGSLPRIDNGYIINENRKPDTLFSVYQPTYEQTKDYLFPAIATLVVYWVFWIAGIGMNIYFLNQARVMEQNTGIRQQNVGCLRALLGFHVVLPVIAVGFILIVALATGNPN